MSRRGKGEGSIFQRKDGRWAGFVTVGYGPDGRQKKKWVYGRTRREVAEKLARLLPKAGYAVVQDPGRLRLGDWLRHWADHRAKSKGLRPATLNTYRHYLQLLEPLASTPLPRLNPLAIQALFAELAERGLSPSVRRHAYQFLKAALRDAVRAGLLERNPVEAVDPPPSGQVRPARAWSAGEAAQFLKAAEGHRLYPMLALMLATGLRIGEALALRWEDWEGDRLWIRHTLRRDGTLGPTKTPRSQGYLYLDPRTQALLAEHRLAQEEEKAVARRWEEHGLIFPSEVGTPLGYRSFLRTWKGLVQKAGVPYVSPHGLRHTYTSLAFRAGLSPKEVAERLRHADPALALRVYQHLQEEDRRRAALGLDTLLHLEASD
ncbi:tyrosine-type recombinase/integrase [Thermus tengchongensis]|uniref:tyrosine-type recombinase/integrase n=1 Tax=Thermus tengchongensis TaxID=1214928 RepID=UPI001F216987|nr:site-specific integrase [Thermus tengchongensis]